MESKNKPIEVLIVEDNVEIDDLENYSQYSESEEGISNYRKRWECANEKLEEEFKSKAMKNFMSIVEKESKFLINIEHKEKYSEDLINLSATKDIIITDIGIPGAYFNFNNYSIDNSSKIRKQLIGGFEKLYGKDWMKIWDGNYITWNVFENKNWGDEFKKGLLNMGYDHGKGIYFEEDIGGLELTRILEKQGKKVTMYTRDLRHQPGIYAGLLAELISPKEVLEIYEKHLNMNLEDSNDLIEIKRPLAINNGRIVIGRSEECTYKGVKDYVESIKIAKDYQLS